MRKAAGISMCKKPPTGLSRANMWGTSGKQKAWLFKSFANRNWWRADTESFCDRAARHSVRSVEIASVYAQDIARGGLGGQAMIDDEPDRSSGSKRYRHHIGVWPEANVWATLT